MFGLIIIVTIGVLFGLWGRSVAIGKGRLGSAWFITCAVTGIVGLVILLTLPAMGEPGSGEERQAERRRAEQAARDSR